MRAIRPTPSQPVFYGQIHFGVFRDPFAALNLVDADVYGHRWAPRWWRSLRLKEWEHFSIIHDEFFCGLAVFDARFMAISSCYVVNRRTGQLVGHSRTAFRRGAVHVPEQLRRGDGFFRQPGYRVDLRNHLDDGTHQVRVDICASHRQPPIRAAFVVREDTARFQPLIAVLPVNDHRRPMYTHQNACPVEGQLQVGEQTWDLDPGRTWALVDAHKAFYPRKASWKRASFAGRDADGVPVAITLTQNVIRDDEQWNANGFWADGCLTLLGAARFEFDPRQTLQPWHLTTTDGRVDLIFSPDGEHVGQLNTAGLLSYSFHQPFGTYRGRVTDDAGEIYAVDGLFGVTGFHLLRA